MAKKAQPHHGGACKVAYADFVTAMMALFMVLWISAQDQKILIATSRYFQNPFHSPMEATNGVLPFNDKKSNGGDGKDSGSEKETTKNKEIEMTFLNSVAAELNRLVVVDKDLSSKPIDIQVTSDGLRLTLFDRARKPLFVGNTAEFTDWGRFVMQTLSWTIDRHHFRVTIDGHTKAKLVLGRENYTAWELSTDRANAARRSLVHYAVDPLLIERVTGYADTKPLDGEKPEAESNQRITLSLTLGSRSHAKAVAENPRTETAPPPTS